LSGRVKIASPSFTDIGPCPPASDDKLSGAVSGQASLEGGGERERERVWVFFLSRSLSNLSGLDEKKRRTRKKKEKTKTRVSKILKKKWGWRVSRAWPPLPLEVILEKQLQLEPF
jgi:hypothetical protein